MQPCSREMQGAIPTRASVHVASLHQLQNGQPLHQIQGAGMPIAATHFDGTAASAHDDFFDQMLAGIPSSWPDLVNSNKATWDLIGGAAAAASTDVSSGVQKLFGMGMTGKNEEADGLHFAAPFVDESLLLAARLRQHQISGENFHAGKPMDLQLNHHHQHMLLQGMVRSSSSTTDSGLFPLPVTTADARIFQDEGSEEIYNGFGGGSLPRSSQQINQQHLQGNGRNFGGSSPSPAVAGQSPIPASAVVGTAPPPRQRVRARRGQATDPHSIAERLRRERIAERMKALQELVPNANKTDKASMLDEIIEYVKFLQLQVKVLSMSRLGGAAAVAPLVADNSSEALGSAAATAVSGDGQLSMTEHQVAKLMEEDMGSAMQYLQGKGLCLMPISLATAISAATSSRNLHHHRKLTFNGDGPPSPSFSVLTVQSVTTAGGAAGTTAASDIEGAPRQPPPSDPSR